MDSFCSESDAICYFSESCASNIIIDSCSVDFVDIYTFVRLIMSNSVSNGRVFHLFIQFLSRFLALLIWHFVQQ